MNARPNAQRVHPSGNESKDRERQPIEIGYIRTWGKSQKREGGNQPQEKKQNALIFLKKLLTKLKLCALIQP